MNHESPSDAIDKILDICGVVRESVDPQFHSSTDNGLSSNSRRTYSFDVALFASMTAA